jgi:hypothetical protein
MVSCASDGGRETLSTHQHWTTWYWTVQYSASLRSRAWSEAVVLASVLASNSEDGTSTSRYFNGVSDWNGRCDLNGDIPSPCARQWSLSTGRYTSTRIASFSAPFNVSNII